MQTAPATVRRLPLRAEVERRVLEITAESFDIPLPQISLQSCLIEDLGADSLDLIEWVTELEEAFQIRIPRDLSQSLFVRERARLASFVDMILWLMWRDDARGEGHVPRPELPQSDWLPFLQLGGRASAREYNAGALYEEIGAPEGHCQFRRATDGMRCVLIPDADVEIGSGDAEALPDQGPMHRVRLSRFLIDAEPVSTTAYARFLNSVNVSGETLHEWCLANAASRRSEYFPLRATGNGAWEPRPGTERQPMILVSWFGANAYSLWANRHDWRHYRGNGTTLLRQDREDLRCKMLAASNGSCLPSEAQWEYAARGPVHRRYPWGDDAPTPHLLCVARHHRGDTYSTENLPAAHVNDRLGVSPFGLHHMAGNVWQWCRDWYAGNFYSQPEAHAANAQNRRPSGIRSERGGSWVGPADLARSSFRRGRTPTAFGRCLGFRCVGAIEDANP